MDQMQAGRLLAAIARLQIAFPGRQLPDDSVALYTQVLAAFPVEAVERAMEDLLRQPGEFIPPVGKICASVAALLQDGSGTTVDDAYAELSRMVRIHGWNQAPIYRDPLIKKTVQALGGWEAICESTNEEALRAHFRRAYQGYLEAERRDIQTGRAPLLPPGSPILSLPGGR